MKNLFFSILLMCAAMLGTVWGYVILYHEPNRVISVPHGAVDISDMSQTVSRADVETQPAQPVTITFAGDMNFDRYIRTMASKNGYDKILVDLRDEMRLVECVFANLEGPITENRSHSEGSAFGSAANYQFTFDPVVSDLLVDHNVCAVNLGNNHIGNFGDAGIRSTKSILREKGIIFVGDTGVADEKRYDVIERNGVRIGVVNINQFVPGAHEHVREDLAAIQAFSDFIVVYTHWGVEYAQRSREMERTLAHELIDAGADVIIGSHPHVTQETEEYKGKKIYYSLGNFVFDQYFQADTQRGLMVDVTFDKERDTITFRDHTICMKNTGITVACEGMH